MATISWRLHGTSRPSLTHFIDPTYGEETMCGRRIPEDFDAEFSKDFGQHRCAACVQASCENDPKRRHERRLKRMEGI